MIRDKAAMKLAADLLESFHPSAVMVQMCARLIQLRVQCDEAEQELEAMEREPRFPSVTCSQCGGEFGPGDHGYSHCESHRSVS